jgi:hypothetical protein
MHNPFHPPPAPPAFGQGKVLPEEQSSLLSKLVFQWLGPFLEVGFSRPLEKDDFWELPTSWLTSKITAEVEETFYARCPPEKRPKLHHHQISLATSAKEETTGVETITNEQDVWKHNSGAQGSKGSWVQQPPEKFKIDSEGQKKV